VIRHDCRLCHGNLKRVLELTPTPLANSYPEIPYGGEKHPLNLMQCVSCGHVQGEYVPSREELYRSYKYVTPAAMQSHWHLYAAKLSRRYRQAKKVLEIGCNSGGMTQELRSRFPDVWGIDPAASGNKMCSDFFTLEAAKMLREQQGKFDLIVANNVFAHIDNLEDVFQGVDWLLSKEGALVFEVQYLPDLVANCAFDTIYHEHHDYHTLGPLQKFMRRFKLEMKQAQRVPVHGGSVRIHARRAAKSERVFVETINWGRFAARIEDLKQGTLDALHGKQVPMFGAPAKATTLVHHFGIQANIAYAVDSTKEKQGRYIPGTGINIYPEEALDGNEAFLAAWNYADFLKKKYPNTRFIVPQSAMRLAA
jgi:SAM-dependent methyltransferase